MRKRRELSKHYVAGTAYRRIAGDIGPIMAENDSIGAGVIDVCIHPKRTVITVVAVDIQIHVGR